MKLTLSQIHQFLAALAATLTILSQTSMFAPEVSKACAIIGFIIALFFVELSKISAQPAVPPVVPVATLVAEITPTPKETP